MVRNNRISWFFGLWLGLETVRYDRYLKSMALGWKAVSFLGLSFLYKNIFMAVSSQNYNATMGAYFRKYSSDVKRDVTDIKDAKRAYFYIDTSEYMNYSNKDLGSKYHTHHGPQPVSFILLLFIIFRKEKPWIAPG